MALKDTEPETTENTYVPNTAQAVPVHAEDNELRINTSPYENG